MLELLKFWVFNPDESRLRAFWRILIQTTLLVLLAIPLGYVLPTVYQFAHPTIFADNITRDRMVLFLSSTPWAMFVNTLFTGTAVVVSIWIAVRFLDKRSMKDVGLSLGREWHTQFIFGFILGAFLISLVFLVEWLAGWITIIDVFSAGKNNSFASDLSWLTLNFILVGLYEEVLSRGYHLKNIAEGFRGMAGNRVSIIIALLISAIVFGVAHATNPEATLFSTVNIVLVGIFLLGFGYVFTGSLGLPIGLHISWNLFQGGIFGFPVSGFGDQVASVFAISQSGDPMITGGAFGPEGGMVGTAAAVIGSLAIMVWAKVRTGRIGMREEIADYVNIPNGENTIATRSKPN